MTARHQRFASTGRVLALAGLFACGGCVHAHHAPPPTSVPATKPDHEHAAQTDIPVASTPQGLMKEGAEKKLQERLREKGLLEPAQCTGRLDPDTRAALRRFQKSQGLPATGLPSYETVDRLGLDLDTIFYSRR
jgi:peptidoglycan hydrolase-like protein with peptidoglycan-binding domain